MKDESDILLLALVAGIVFYLYRTNAIATATGTTPTKTSPSFSLTVPIITGTTSTGSASTSSSAPQPTNLYGCKDASGTIAAWVTDASLCGDGNTPCYPSGFMGDMSGPYLTC